MRHALTLALVPLALTSVAPAPPQAITALAPVEVVADGFGSLRGIVVADDDTVYVADREAGTVSRIGADGRRVVARRLDRPIGLALDAEGRVLVAEERGGRVVRLDPTGPTTLAQGITQPRWLAVSERGTLYVSARRLTRDADPEPDDESAEPEAILSLNGDGVLTVFADGFDHLQGLAMSHDTLYAATTGLRGVHRQDSVVYRIPVLADGRAGRVTRLGPRDAFERPVGLALDRLDALFAATPSANLDGSRPRQNVVKLHPDGSVTLFASGLGNPRGLAFDRHGHLYVADGSSGRVLRFVAPPAPALTVPPFTKQTSLTLSGTTAPQARIDAFVNDAGTPVTAMSSASGSFAATIAPVPNTSNTVEVVATAVRGKGLTSPATQARFVHDTLAPALVLQAPAAGGFVRGTVEVRADVADAGSEVAALSLAAAGQTLSTSIVPLLPTPSAVATANWSTIGVADGTQTVTATAADRAGTSASASRVVIVDNTPPETEIIAGPSGSTVQSSAAFTLGGSDNLTPAASLQFAWRLDGGPLSPFAADRSVTLTSLSPGDHVFEAVARDLAGNVDPAPVRRTFSVGLSTVALTITAPAAGATVPAGILVVRGGVTGAGPEVGISVNGSPALVHGGHWAAEIPIAPGTNLVSATASTAPGAGEVASITVTGSAAPPGLVLRAEPSSGIAPLPVTWRLESRASRPLVRFELDERGDGIFGPPRTTLDGTQSIYATAGLLFPTVRATDDQGNVYLGSTVVQVDDPQAATARFQALWASFKGRLQAGDPAGALTLLTAALGARFERVFQQLGSALPAIVVGLGPIELIDQVGNLAEAAIVQSEDGVSRLYFVYFRRDNRGRWLIQEM